MKINEIQGKWSQSKKLYDNGKVTKRYKMLKLIGLVCLVSIFFGIVCNSL